MRIGFQIVSIDDPYSLNMWPYLIQMLTRMGHSAVLLPGNSPNDPEQSKRDRVVIYNMINKENLDGILLLGATFINFLDRHEWNKFFEPFLGKIPVFSIGECHPEIPCIITSGRSGIIEALEHLYYEHGCTKIGFIKGLEGNPEALERFDVYKEGLKSLNLEYNEKWVFEGDFIAKSGVRVAQHILHQYKTLPFNAIIASNDEMAHGLMNTLIKNGLKIPSDLAIVGFDDNRESLFSSTTLATCAQPFKRQVEIAIEKLIKIIEGHEVDNQTILNTHFIPRASCGCISYIYTQFEENLSPALNIMPGHLFDELLLELPILDSLNFGVSLNELLEVLTSLSLVDKSTHTFLNTLEGLISQYLSNRITSSDWSKALSLIFAYIKQTDSKKHQFLEETNLMIISQYLIGCKYQVYEGKKNIEIQRLTIEPLQNMMLDLHYAQNEIEIYRNLENYLVLLGFNHAYIVLYENSENDHAVLNSPYGEIPEKSTLSLRYENGKVVRLNKDKTVFPTLNLLPDGVKDIIDFNFIILPLFIQQSQLGFILLDIIDTVNPAVYEGIRQIVSSALRSVQLFGELEEANSKLEDILQHLKKSNARLQVESHHDPLTNLLNRRGFLTQTEMRIKTCQTQQIPYMIFFADMDGLKKINDTYGHKAGDEAIKTMGIILQNVFRGEDLVSRFGGDEFTIFAAEIPDNFLDILRQRLLQSICCYNKSSSLPYKIGISIGECPIDPFKMESLEDLLNKADEALYEEKASKQRCPK